MHLMEQRKTTRPYKQIRPFLTQLFFYTSVAVGSIVLLEENSSILDKVLAGLLWLLCMIYAYKSGHRIFRTSYTIAGSRAIIRRRGNERILDGDDVQYAYYDSNSRNMELHAKDGTVIQLVEYDDLRPLVDFLDDRGIRMDYKRITQK